LGVGEYLQGQGWPERLKNQRTWATSTTGGVAGGGIEGTVGCGFAPTRPGSKKSSGETLLDAVMPPQPLVSTISAKETAPIVTFRFTLQETVQF